MSTPEDRPSALDLIAPILRGDLSVIDALMAAGVPLDVAISGASPPLHLAIESGGTPAVRRLIAGGADVNGRESQRGRTPLILAASRGKREVVEALLAAGADVALGDSVEWTALDAAAAHEGGPAGAIVAALVAAGSPVERLSRTWGTPLVKAAWQGHPSAVSALLAARADVNRPTPSGTPLLQAVQHKRPDVVTMLLAAGADPAARYAWPETLRFNEMFVGKTAVDVARATRSKQVMAALTGPPPVPPATPTAADVPRLWAALKRKGLAGPATGEQIAALAAVVGSVLPDDVVASYRVHNGQTRGTVTGPFGLLSTGEAANEWEMWKGLADGGEFRGREATPDDGVRSDWWHPGWVPVLSDGGGDSVCVDLAPTDSGTAGQVIVMRHDAAERRVVAKSWADYLGRLAAGVF